MYNCWFIYKWSYTIIYTVYISLLVVFIVTSFFTELQNLRPEIPRCCPSALANVMKRCWDANPDKRPEMDEVVSMLEAIDTSKGGGMIPHDQPQGCLCFRRYRGPWKIFHCQGNRLWKDDIQSVLENQFGFYFIEGIGKEDSGWNAYTKKCESHIVNEELCNNLLLCWAIIFVKLIVLSPHCTHFYYISM